MIFLTHEIKRVHIKSLALKGYSFIEIDPVLNRDQSENVININIMLNEGPSICNNIDIEETQTIDKVQDVNFLFLKVMHTINSN